MSIRMTARLGVGTRVAFDGQQWEVCDLAADRVAIRTQNGEARSVAVPELLSRGRLLVEQPAPAPAVGPVLAGLDEAERRQLKERRAHVLEVLTGYKSGTPDRPQSGEPQPEYAPHRRKQDRIGAKAAELGLSTRTVRRWVDDYQQLGDVGLVDGRRVRRSDPLAGIDDRWTEMAQLVLSEGVRSSRRPRSVILDEIQRRLKEEEVRLGAVPVPKRSKARAALAELARGTNAFVGSAKGKRSIANRPPTPYGRLRAVWPGQYLFLDTTRLNVFAMAPVTLEWVQAELSVALDLFSRCVVAVRLTPVSTKAVDAAGLLYEAICPDSKARTGTGILPYTGVPAMVFCDSDKATDRPGLPDVVPDTIIVDHGKIYLSDHVRSVCARLGISIQPARPWRPTDKAPLERFYRTIDGDLLSRLPGYKGPDIHSRGEHVEDERYYFLHELEEIIREWVAERYHTQPHDGLVEPTVPGLQLSPLEMLRMGIARTGRLAVPARPDLAYDFLATAWRTIQHYGVDVNGLRYDGPGLNPWRNRRSPYHGKYDGDWPIRYDPDDISRVFFQDPNDHTWHVLRWVHAPDVPTPFSAEVWAYARRLALKADRFHDAERVLADLLERWNIGLTGDRRERRMALRLSRQDAARFPHAAGDAAGNEALAKAEARFADAGDRSPTPPTPGDDDDPDEVDATAPDDLAHFYDDALEVLR